MDSKYRANKLSLIEELILNNTYNNFKIHSDYNKEIETLQKEGFLNEFQELTNKGRNYIFYKSPILGDIGTNQFKVYFNRNAKQYGLALAMSFLNSDILNTLSKNTRLHFLKEVTKKINESSN